MRDLEHEMDNDPIVIQYLGDENTAQQFYRALCNTDWAEIISDEDEIINRLKGDGSIWSCSWRRAGGIIAEIRNTHYNTTEDYMSWYCSGLEGDVTELVEECFKRMGWKCLH